MGDRTPNFVETRPEIKASDANPAKLAEKIRSLESRVTKLETELLDSRGEDSNGTGDPGEAKRGPGRPRKEQ